MKTTDAAQILGLSGTITPEDVKHAYGSPDAYLYNDYMSHTMTR